LRRDVAALRRRVDSAEGQDVGRGHGHRASSQRAPQRSSGGAFAQAMEAGTSWRRGSDPHGAMATGGRRRHEEAFEGETGGNMNNERQGAGGRGRGFGGDARRQ
jgi:hypothetical protein